MKPVHLSSDANLDIEEITNYIFDLNPVAAYRFLDNLDETWELLAEFPLIGRLRRDLGADIRSYPVENYLVFYVPTADGIEVARVIYGGRDLPKIFKLRIQPISFLDFPLIPPFPLTRIGCINFKSRFQHGLQRRHPANGRQNFHPKRQAQRPRKSHPPVHPR